MDEGAGIQTKFIWVVSYPKSGNTWMRLLLREYIKRTTGERPFETGDHSLYFYQTVSPIPLETLTPQGFVQIRPAAMMHLQTIYGARKNDWRPYCVVKSHTATGDLHGVPFFSPLWVDRAIYIHRDPRDVLPSFADHIGVPLEEAAETMANSQAQLGQPPMVPQLISSWSAHTRSWIADRDNQRVNTVVTSYEKMHEDTAGELRRILEFCEIPIDEQAIKEAVRACVFDRLRAREEEEGFEERSKQSERFFRRGIVGSHKDEVPRELVAKIESDHMQMMRLLGYV